MFVLGERTSERAKTVDTYFVYIILLLITDLLQPYHQLEFHGNVGRKFGTCLLDARLGRCNDEL